MWQGLALMLVALVLTCSIGAGYAREAARTEPVNFHEANAAEAANVAQQAAKVAKRVAAHTEEVADNTAAALRYTQDALKLAGADSDDVDELGREAERLEDEAGGTSNDGSQSGRSSSSSTDRDNTGDARGSQMDRDEDSFRRSRQNNREGGSRSTSGSGEDIRDGRSSQEIQNGGSSQEISNGRNGRRSGSGSSDSNSDSDRDQERQWRQESGGRISRMGGSSNGRSGSSEGSEGSVGGDGREGGGEGTDGERSLDVNGEIVPYPSGVEPFGQEEPAKELTEESVKQSDGMVKQIEHTQGVEAQRSVYRALTKLRGATIASYDGMAKGHLKNVDNYNKKHKWREDHPMKHLAEEEADTHIWAFPSNKKSKTSKKDKKAPAGINVPPAVNAAPAPAPAA